MKHVAVEAHGKLAVVRLQNGVTNAIGLELVTDLAGILQEVPLRFDGMVLAGGRKFFSIGLDLPALLELEREPMAQFWEQFDTLVAALYTLSLPTVCAIAGHATAGGTILALACDHRMVAEGRKLIGLNEINIGVPVPFLADLMLRQIVSERSATAMIYGGELLLPDKARQIGLADDICPEDTIEAAALALAERLAAKPHTAFALVKANRVAAVRRRFERDRHTQSRAFLDCWFEPAVQAMLAEAAEKF
jgi:enoyl-CoA hydratase/carnithine racemase